MYYYILNPASGGGRINKIQDRLKTRLKELGIAGEFVKSIGEGDVTKLTQMGIRKGFKTIVAVGGNGTLSEVINGIGNSEVAVGVVPIGNKNELARTLGINDWTSALNILAARKIDILDIGKIGKSYFITSVNIGFDAQMAAKKPEDKSILDKTLFYKKAISWSSKFKPQKATLNFNDDYRVTTDFFNIRISNSRIPDTKGKELNSNLLEVMITGKMSTMTSFKYIMNSDAIKKERKPDISIFKTKKVVINTEKPQPVSVDGKVLYRTPVLCEVSGKKLKMIVARKKAPLKQTAKKTVK